MYSSSSSDINDERVNELTKAVNLVFSDSAHRVISQMAIENPSDPLSRQMGIHSMLEWGHAVSKYTEQDRKNYKKLKELSVMSTKWKKQISGNGGGSRNKGNLDTKTARRLDTITDNFEDMASGVEDYSSRLDDLMQNIYHREFLGNTLEGASNPAPSPYLALPNKVINKQTHRRSNSRNNRGNSDDDDCSSSGSSSSSNNNNKKPPPPNYNASCGACACPVHVKVVDHFASLPDTPSSPPQLVVLKQKQQKKKKKQKIAVGITDKVAADDDDDDDDEEEKKEEVEEEEDNENIIKQL